MRLYLAGPINGCTDDEASGWRDEVKRALDDQLRPNTDFVIDPMMRDERGREGDEWKSIVEADKASIDACDAVLACCWKSSVGTSMEVLYAWERGKVVVVVARDPSPWLRYHSHAVVDRIPLALTLLRRKLVRA